MGFNKILVFYKKSVLDMHHGSLPTVKNSSILRAINKAHADHYESLDLLIELLKETGLPYRLLQRGKSIPRITANHLAISLGGDGTFIYASHHVDSGSIIGINSAPASSVGFYCRNSLYDRNFDLPHLIEDMNRGRLKPKKIQRLNILLNGKSIQVPVLNDILITENNPATTSRYQILLRGRQESQKSSGIWISTATGSTAAYQSAGGRPFRQTDTKGKRQFGVKVRELYKEKSVRLIGGLVKDGEPFAVTSAMANGRIYVDGGYLEKPFSLGDTVKVKFYRHPLKIYTDRRL